MVSIRQILTQSWGGRGWLRPMANRTFHLTVLKSDMENIWRGGVGGGFGTGVASSMAKAATVVAVVVGWCTAAVCWVRKPSMMSQVGAPSGVV